MNTQEIIDAIKKLIVDYPFAYFTLALSKKNPELRNFILENSKFLDGKISIKTKKPFNNTTRIVYALNGLVDFPKCITCGNPIQRDVSLKEDLNHMHCCNRCAQKSPETIAKTKATKMKNHGDPNYNNMDKNRQTCKEKYGVEYSWQVPEVQAKSKQSLKDHFGVDHQMRSDEVKYGMRKRYKEKHGVEYAFQNPKVQAKINAKIQEKFGVDWPMQSKELHAIMHHNSAITQKKNCYYNVVCNDKNVSPLFSVDEYVKYGSCDREHEFKWKCRKCGKEFMSRIMYGCSYFARCYDCYPIMKSTSQFEKDVYAFINTLGNGIEAFNKTSINKQIIPPQEIDVVVKKNGNIVLLVETDGLYWHSMENGKDSLYHKLKTDKCNSLNYQLVHIFEDEWKNKQEIVKSRIKNLLGIYDNVVYARKCHIKELNIIDAKEFFEATHIQGYCQAHTKLGLFFGDELVAAMTFGHRRKITNAKCDVGEYELLRFSTKLGYHVIGAAGKMLNYFERTTNDLKMLISYADVRWSIGKLYYALGFSLDHKSSPNYWYMPPKYDERLYRYGFRKSVQKDILPIFDPNKSEIDNMLANGYHVIWDCGNYVFKKTYV